MKTFLFSSSIAALQNFLFRLQKEDGFGFEALGFICRVMICSGSFYLFIPAL